MSKPAGRLVIYSSFLPAAVYVVSIGNLADSLVVRHKENNADAVPPRLFYQLFNAALVITKDNDKVNRCQGHLYLYDTSLDQYRLSQMECGRLVD